MLAMLSRQQKARLGVLSDSHTTRRLRGGVVGYGTPADVCMGTVPDGERCAILCLVGCKGAVAA